MRNILLYSSFVIISMFLLFCAAFLVAVMLLWLSDWLQDLIRWCRQKSREIRRDIKETQALLSSEEAQPWVMSFEEANAHYFHIGSRIIGDSTRALPIVPEPIPDTPITEPPIVVKKCPACLVSYREREEHRFCSHCGYWLAQPSSEIPEQKKFRRMIDLREER